MAGEFSHLIQGVRLGLKRCLNAKARKEAAKKMKKEKKMVMVKERMTTEEVERLLSFVPRPFPLRDEKPRCNDPEINEFEDMLTNTVLLLNSNAQIILGAQAKACEELRTKGYIEYWVAKSFATTAADLHVSTA